jgi:hypothetical protein
MSIERGNCSVVAKKVTEEIKVYTEEDHLESVDDKVRDAFGFEICHS